MVKILHVTVKIPQDNDHTRCKKAIKGIIIYFTSSFKSTDFYKPITKPNPSPHRGKRIKWSHSQGRKSKSEKKGREGKNEIAKGNNIREKRKWKKQNGGSKI